MSSISSIVSAQQLNFLTDKKANPLHAIEAQIAAISPPNASDRTIISDAARDIFSSNPNASSAAGNDGTAAFDTNEGSKSIDISDYFSPIRDRNGEPLSFPPLLLPSQGNIDALTKHISAILPNVLAQNNILYPPASITYDTSGAIRFPSDYPYASEFKQALNDNPAVARELSVVNALSSVLADVQRNVPSGK